ncbi:hypothetical protein EON65_39330, partial [archaeon]
MKITDSMIATYMQEMLTILDCPTITQRQRLSAEDIVGPLQVLFEFGELDASGVVENMMRPVVLFGEHTSELGMIGTCIWERKKSANEIEVKLNEIAGWTFKTKPVGIDEMSVVKGYGCFDC